MSRVILSCLNDFTNKGLYLVAMLLTGGEIKFEKTRWNMKKVIRVSLPKVFGSQNHTHQEMKVSSQLSQLLNDPQNFRDNYVPFLTKSQVQHAAAAKILDGLRDLPSQTLIAMHRKLKGMQQSMPQLQPSRNGWNRDYLIKQVRKTSKQLLSELGTEDQLQEPLAKAMAIAALSLKLMPGFHNSSLEEFYQFSPDIEMLQKQITKAICLIRTTFRTADLKKFQLLLDPKAKVPIRCLRTAIKKMLTEYLFDCSDMVSIPESLLETLDIINGNSRITPNGCTLRDEIEEEVECILNVSAHAKQIVGDLLVDHDFDIDFTDAYMEDLEESDDDYGYCDGDIDNDRIDDDDEYDDSNGLQGDRISQNSSTGSLDPNREVASTGDSESIFIDGHGTRCSTMVDSVDIPDSRRVMSEKFIETSGPVYQGMGPESIEHQWNGNQTLEKGVNHDHISHKNQYLAIQEVCDETSMATHKIIGHMLGAFVQIQDLDLLWYDRLYLKGDYVEEDSEGIQIAITLLFGPFSFSLLSLLLSSKAYQFFCI